MILNYKKWSHINEQSEEKKAFTQVQKFLNAKKLMGADGTPLVEDGNPGENTSTAITKYQTAIGVLPTDGVWGPVTMSKMPKKDRELYDSMSSWL